MSFIISLRRHDTSTPWGFRMNGGLEYGQPLYIQKVNPHSMAERAGLQVGDGILQIGHIPTNGMKHDTAKMEIIRAGNDVDFIVQRNVVAVTPPPFMQEQPQLSPDIVQEHSSWRGNYAQNPNVQSRSFKIIQQQLSSEAQ